jgi:exodeoxyribonuclease VII small subunit
MTTQKPSFEENMKNLEEIVKKLETNDLTLDESVSLYQEGVKLSLLCSNSLEEAEKKVSMISEDINGTVHVSDFDGDQ